MDDNFFHTTRGTRPVGVPQYDKDGWAPHPTKPGWHVNKQGHLRGPDMNGGIPQPKEAYKEPPYPFPGSEWPNDPDSAAVAALSAADVLGWRGVHVKGHSGGVVSPTFKVSDLQSIGSIDSAVLSFGTISSNMPKMDTTEHRADNHVIGCSVRVMISNNLTRHPNADAIRKFIDEHVRDGIALAEQMMR